jgi:glycosyltransferase involved in cell wall biosynthesis
MKVVFATHFFPPGAAGGTESYTLGLARQLQSMGHEPYVVCAEHWGQGDTFQVSGRDAPYSGIPVRRLSWNWELADDPFVNLYDNKQAEAHVARLLSDLRPDVMHITSCYALGAGIIRAARSVGVPTVLTLTDFWFISPRQTLRRGDGSLCDGPASAAECARCLAADAPLYRALSRVLPDQLVVTGLTTVNRVPALARRRGLRGYVGDVAKRLQVLRRMFEQVDVAIAPSQALKDVYARNGFPAERLRLSPYGLDQSWTAHVQPRPAGAPLSLGYIGQIEPIKGVDVLVRALRELPHRGWTLEVFGDLDKNPSYTRLLRQLSGSDPRIRYHGLFERPAIANIFSQIDALVVPSVWLENAPVVISEAFAARKPVVATDLPGLSELVDHDVNGLLFPRGDATALGQVLSRLFDEVGLVQRLASGIKPVRSIQEEASALLETYRGLNLRSTAA